MLNLNKGCKYSGIRGEKQSKNKASGEPAFIVGKDYKEFIIQAPRNSRLFIYICAQNGELALPMVIGMAGALKE